MGTASRFHTEDPFLRHNTVFTQELRILLGIYVIGDNPNAVITCHFSGQAFYQGRFPGTYRTCHSYFYI